MTIAVASYDYDPPIGGLGIVAKRYVDAWNRGKEANDIAILAPCDGSSIAVLRLLKKYRGKPGSCPLFSLVLQLVLVRFLKKNKVDRLLIHAGSGGVVVLSKPCCPLVVVAHHTYRQELRSLSFAHGLHRIWKHVMAWLECRTYRLADSIVCVSADTQRAIVELYGIDPMKTVVIENPIDDSYFCNRQRQPVPHTLVYVGRVEERKGIEVLLRAFELVQRSLPDALLVLIGRNLMGDWLQSYIRTKGLESFIEIRGYLGEQERIDAMLRATAIVIPSKLEGFGLIAAEAMALGVCVIASDCDGLHSLIDDGRTGFLFPSNDGEQASRLMEQVLTNDVRRSTVELNARGEAARRFRTHVQADLLHSCLMDATKVKR